MHYVYVISKTGKPLMPTRRYRHVRWLLKQKKARVVRRDPFTIQLLYDSTEHTQPLTLGIDPGCDVVGIAVRKENKEVVFTAEVHLRTREVTEKMTERRMARRNRRNYRRLRRKRRAKKAKTLFGTRQYKIAGIKDPIECKDIKPKLIQFLHRKRTEDWLTPTARHLLESHQNLIKKIRAMLPITKVVVEYARFDNHKLSNPEVEGIGYQQGRMQGCSNEHEYVLVRDKHSCQLCEKTKVPLRVHHVIWRSQGGSDLPENLVTLCLACHDRVHKKPKVDAQVKELFQSMKKRFTPASILNTIMPGFYEWLTKQFKSVQMAFGYETKTKRWKGELWKAHYVDAYLASLEMEAVQKQEMKEKLDECLVYEFKQFRRHNRQLIHARRDRNYYEKKEKSKKKEKDKIVAKNRHKRTGQQTASLPEYVLERGEKCLGRLRVERGRKVVRTKKENYKVGDVVLQEDHTLGVVTGSGHNGYSVMLYGLKKYVVAAKCKPLLRNCGLVCIGKVARRKESLEKMD